MANEYYAVIRCNSLQHHGIKGQKWGIRRFQNEDGTLTEAGKKRYYENGERITPIKGSNKEGFTKKGDKFEARERRRLRDELDPKVKEAMSSSEKNLLNVGFAEFKLADEKYWSVLNRVDREATKDEWRKAKVEYKKAARVFEKKLKTWVNESGVLDFKFSYIHENDMSVGADVALSLINRDRSLLADNIQDYVLMKNGIY